MNRKRNCGDEKQILNKQNFHTSNLQLWQIQY